jgi:hypothetical protein
VETLETIDTHEKYRRMVREASATGHWTKAAIDALLKVSDKAVERALTRLYELQTADEKQAQQTKHTNGKGFSALDAEIFSSFAAQINRGRNLSPRQLAICRKPAKNGFARLTKYYGQIAQMIFEKSPERKS